MSVAIAIVGGGKIARDQHMPALAASGDFTLAAAVTLPGSELPGLPNFPTIAAMKAACPEVTAVAICTPPGSRHALAEQAIAAGLDILNEKPPAANLAEAQDMAARAKAAGLVFYQTWHSRNAAAVAPARAWLTGKTIRRIGIVWKEDVRMWHPGQAWIWDPGVGVFDCGINALSVATAILPHPLRLQAGELRFPANKNAPIAARLRFSCGDAEAAAEFDFDQKGPPTWTIDIATDTGDLELSKGASRMSLDGKEVDVGKVPEYAALYDRFAALLAARQSDADFTPFAHVEEALRLGTRIPAEPFV